ncbi:MAG: MurT ligase domain-containing protein [Eubacteriales bacterium]|nr:MurT ligase domain-containing protein [Eubacteriales bacterium]
MTILIVRLTTAFMKLIGLNATHFPGQLAKRLCPDFLSRLEKPDTIIGITGTNGKTTISNLVADMAKHYGLDFSHNAYGSNIEEGIITTLLDAASFFGKRGKNLAILEIDERLTRVVFPDIKPDYLIVSNLFRESYLRNAHAEFIYGILKDNIPAETKLILNADDMLSSNLAEGHESVSFSIARLAGEPQFNRNLIRDVVLCPRCHQPLIDEFIRYHHIGRAHCENCLWHNGPGDFELTGLQRRDSIESEITADEMSAADSIVVKSKRWQDADSEQEFPFAGENILDLYNSLAAITLYSELGYSPESIADALSKVSIGKSRKEIVKIGPHTVYRMLAKGKNPIAVTRVLDTIVKRPGDKYIILLVDTSVKEMSPEDNVSWIFDADLDLLNSDDVKQIVVAGMRSEDIRLALLFAGVPASRIVSCRNKEESAETLELSDKPATVAILYELYSENVSRKIVKDLQNKLEGQ